MSSASQPSYSHETDVEEPVTPIASHEDAAILSSYLDQFGPTGSHTDSHTADGAAVSSATLAAVESLLSGTDSEALDGFLDNLLGPLPGDSISSPPHAAAVPTSTSDSAPASAADVPQGSAHAPPPQLRIPPIAAAAAMVAPPFVIARPAVFAPLAPSAPAVRTHRVIVTVPSRGGKQREISRVITHDAQAQPFPPALPAADKRPREGAAAVVSAGSAGSSSAGAAGPSANPLSAAEPRERCSLCGATKRGFGRGYCSNVSCRERSTLVVRYEQRQSGGGKAAKLAAHNTAVPVLSVTAAAGAAGARSPAKPARAVVVAHAAAPRAAAPVTPERALLTATSAESLAAPHDAPPAYDVLGPAPSAAAAAAKREPTSEPASEAIDEGDLLTETYVLALPLGFAGAHWFYLGRPRWGWLYVCTFGLLGFGWLADVLRAPSLVRRSARRGFDAADGSVELADAYVLCASPLGLLCALHHWQLQRKRWALLHCLTLGLCGVGWLVDLCRLPSLVREYNDGCALEASRVARTTRTPTPSEDLEHGISLASIGSDSARM